MNQLLLYLAPTIGLVTLAIGLSAIFRPEPMSKKYGVSVAGSALPYVIATGARDVFIGLSLLILFWFQQWMALGYVHLAIAFVAICDLLIVRKFGDRKTSLVHLTGAVIVIIYGTWLINQ